ncbi:MAG: hypothetical protein J6Y08_04230 [Clostridiales bacterium]|nr:hypothetical protein [Clostridiales bacterium]
MLKDLGINGGTLIICLVTGYFVIKWAVKAAIVEAYESITGEKTEDELEVERMMAEDAERRKEAAEAYRARKEAKKNGGLPRT